MPQPRVAAIVTEYRPRSHADVIVTKLLEGYSLYGARTEPRIEVVSLYLDQVPDTDIGIEMARKHNVPIFGTIGEAMAVGTRGVNVDGVLLIGEHGDYPWNDREQKLYPRRRFFDAAVSAMVAAGRFVPIFNDKHLSWSFDHARTMYDTAERLGIPFLAGSSVPVAWRDPAIDWPLGGELKQALALGFSGLEIYGFHTLEALQCMVERRTGGEVGVRAVQCLEGDAVWQAAGEGRWNPDLFEAALATLGSQSVEEAKQKTPDPAIFLIEYRDGLQAATLMLTGAIRQFAFAGRADGDITACAMILESGEPHGHFTFLVRQIESMMLTGQPPYPVARTLLTTGILDAIMNSRHDGNVELETPWLDISYQPTEEIPDTGNGAPLPAKH